MSHISDIVKWNMKVFVGLLFAVLCGTAWSGDKSFWRGRTVYQLLTDRFGRTDGKKEECKVLSQYCGGTFSGITKNLDYITGMGFDAIWISPIIDNFGEAYHGYHGRDWTKVNGHFGSEADLKELIEECHKRNVAVMLDVVANHVGPVGLDYHEVVPFNKSEHYHDYCYIQGEDFATHNQWKIENCRLAGLGDLKQENPEVEKLLLDWIKNILHRFPVDGLRIDTTPEVPKWFWTKFTEAVKMFTIGEVFDGNFDYLRGYIGPLHSVLNYIMFFALRDAFEGKKTFIDLHCIIEDVFNTFGRDLDYMGMFVNNHDNNRFLNFSSCADCLKGAIAFSLLFPGIPIFYYGDEQLYHGGIDPLNREDLWSHMNIQGGIYQWVKKLVGVRKSHAVWNYPFVELFSSHHYFAFSRGDVLAAFSVGSSFIPFQNLNVTYPDNTKLTEVFSGEEVVVKNGKVSFTLPLNGTKIFEVTSQPQFTL